MSETPAPSSQNQPAAPSQTWQPLTDLRRAVDRLFDNFSRGSVQPADWQPTMHRYFSLDMPAVDISEKDSAFEITAELPGVAPKDVDVSVRNGSISIRGEKSGETESDEKGYHLRERQYGSFERLFAIPSGVDSSAIEATFRDGILKVTMPKTIEAQKPAKKIEVKSQ